MTVFHYVAQRDGAQYEGSVEAEDRFSLYAHVRAEGGTLISMRSDTGWGMQILQQLNERFSTIKEHDIIVLSRNLGAMIDAGLPLSRALAVVERQSRNPKLKKTMRVVGADVGKGNTLHTTLKRFPHIFSRLFVAMVKAGEESGTLPDALTTVAEQMERSYTLKKKIRGALMYPAVVVIAMIGIGVLMLIKVVPTLSQTFNELGADLPNSTKIIIGLSDAMVNNTFSVVLGGILGVLSIIAGLRTQTGKRIRDTVFIRMPIIGLLVRQTNAARMARTLSSLLNAGVDVVTALKITSEVVQNIHHSEVISGSITKVEKGTPVSAAFIEREDLYPALVGEMMAVGEETGKLSDMLAEVAAFYEEEVARTTKDMSTIIEPFLMLVIGAGVGFFAISMIAPIYSLSESI